MQASSEHSVCFAVPENEVKAVSAALHTRFRQALEAGRLSKVFGIIIGRDVNEMLHIIIFSLDILGFRCPGLKIKTRKKERKKSLPTL